MTRKPYPTDVTDDQWALLEPLLPPARPGGRPREVDVREVVNALFYRNRNTMPGHLADHVAQGRHMPGVFLIKRIWDTAELAEQLALIAGASLVDEYRDQVTHLPIT